MTNRKLFIIIAVAVILLVCLGIVIYYVKNVMTAYDKDGMTDTAEPTYEKNSL